MFAPALRPGPSAELELMRMENFSWTKIPHRPLAFRLASVFPELNVIIALRDPRDVVLSCYFQNNPIETRSM